MRERALKTDFQQTVQTSLSARLASMAREMEQVASGSRIITSTDEMEAIATSMRAMVEEARQMEGEPEKGFVNEAAVAAVQEVYAAEDCLRTARLLLVERHDRRDADPAGKIRSGLAQASAKIEQVQAILTGGRAVQS